MTGSLHLRYQIVIINNQKTIGSQSGHYRPMDYTSKTDTQLVKLTLENQEIFLYLMQRYEARLLRYIRRLSGFNQGCAEDILQESFLKIYKNLNDFDQDLQFSTWAYRITHNEAINYLKKISNEKIIPLETDDQDVVSLINILESDIDIAKDMAKKELQEKVQKIISMLSPQFREILVLKFLEDKSYQEISDILEKPMGTIATLINRAKEQFKKVAEKNNLIYVKP